VMIVRSWARDWMLLHSSLLSPGTANAETIWSMRDR
jgi:hypothetical protein